MFIASDHERSNRFYTEALGLRIVREVYREDRMSYKLDLELEGGVRIELFRFPDPPGRVSNPETCGLRHLALAVADFGAEIAKLSSFHVSCEPVRVDEFTGARFTFFRDPDDLPIELYEVR